MEKDMNDIQDQIVDDQEQEIVGDEFDFGEDVEIIEDDDLDNDETETEEETSETEEAKEDAKVKQEIPKKKEQDKETNSKFAAARRDAEARAKKAEEERNAIFKKLGITKAEELDDLSLDFTEEEKAKLEEEADDLGEDSETYILKKQMQRWMAKANAESAVKKANEELKKKAELEIQEFNKAFGIDVDSVLKDAHFMEYADGKIGTRPLVEIYEKYLAFTGQTRDAAIQRQARRTERSTSGGQSSKIVQLTRAEAMSLKKWNESVEPSMRMTPSEFKKYK